MRPALARALAVVPYLALTLPWSHIVPMWDAREYVDCIEAAVRGGPLRCAGHPTEAWTLLMSPLAAVFPDQFWAVLAMSIALGVIGLLAFQDLVLAIFPDAGVEAAVLTAAMGVFPVIVSGAVDVNPDHGVLMLLVIAVRCLVRGSLWQATLAGLVLTFTKEPGAMMFGVSALLWGAFFLRGVRTWLRAWPLALPPVAFAAYLFFGPLTGGALWTSSQPVSLWETFTTLRFDQPFIAQLIGIFIMQFAWLLTLAALVRWALVITGQRRSDPRAMLYCDVLLAVGTLLLTRYVTYLNLRYYICLFPFLLLCAWAGTREFLRSRAGRITAFAVIGALFAASSLRTIDPVSKALFGTISFGTHEMLAMTRPTGECCGYGRDQLAYNLEHLHLGELEQMVLDDFRTDPEMRVLAGSFLSDHHTVGAIDRTFTRTLSPGGFAPRIWSAVGLDRWRFRGGRLPARLLYMRFFFVPNANDEARINRLYRPVGTKTYDVDGYTLTVVDYLLRRGGS